MERSKRIITTTIVLLAIWHQVGVIGLHLEQSRALFQSLIFLNLLLSVGILGLFHREWTMNFGIFSFVVFWAGYLIELVGVKTGVIFGVYQYGASLGPRVADVPPMIGVNWLMLTYMSGIISQKWSSNIWIKTSLGALLMVGLDLLIEPMAVRYDMWTWQGDLIPIQNYFAWFVIAWGMNYGFHALNQEKSNPIALPLYIIQLAFFFTFFVIHMSG